MGFGGFAASLGGGSASGFFGAASVLPPSTNASLGGGAASGDGSASLLIASSEVGAFGADEAVIDTNDAANARSAGPMARTTKLRIRPRMTTPPRIDPTPTTPRDGRARVGRGKRL